MMFGRMERVQNTDDGAGGGGFDMESGVEAIADGLGLGADDDNDDPDLGTDTVDGGGAGGAPAPAPAPAPTAAPAAPAASPAPVAASPGPAAPAPAPGGPPAVDLNKPPSTWTAGAQAHWAALPEAVRADVHKREQDMWRGIEQYKGLANVGQQAQQAVAPIMPLLRERGIPPAQFVGNMTNMYMQLSDARVPAAERAQLAGEILKTFGIDVGLLSGQPAADDAYIDPEVKNLRQTVAQLESRLNGQDQARFQEHQSNLWGQLNKFAEGKPYFDDVVEDMTLLIRGSGGTMSLQDAYDKAVYANPVTRAKEVDRLTAEKTAAERKAEKERADAAVKARGANVKSRRHQANGGTAVTGSIDDTLEATMADIESRGSK